MSNKLLKSSRVLINPFNRQNLSRLDISYWWLVAIGAIFTLARFSEAFLVLRAMNIGMSISMAPVVMVIMNFVYAISSYPFGRLADNMSHSKLLMIGIMVLIVADILLAVKTQGVFVMIGVALWGLHMGTTWYWKNICKTHTRSKLICDVEWFCDTMLAIVVLY